MKLETKKIWGLGERKEGRKDGKKEERKAGRKEEARKLNTSKPNSGTLVVLVRQFYRPYQFSSIAAAC